MKLKFILLLLTFSANVFLFSQNKTSNNKKSEFEIAIEKGSRRLDSLKKEDKFFVANSFGQARQDYEAMGYGEVAKAENWKKLNDMFSDDLLTKEELETKLADLEEKQMKEKKAAEINLKKEKLYKAYQEGIITLEEYNAKLNSL